MPTLYAASLFLNLATTVVGPTTLGGDRVLALEDERRFFWLLDEALRRIVAFYGARLEHVRAEAARELSQLSHLRSEAERIVAGGDDHTGGAIAYRAFRGSSHNLQGERDHHPRHSAGTSSDENNPSDETVNGGGGGGKSDGSSSNKKKSAYNIFGVPRSSFGVLRAVNVEIQAKQAAAVSKALEHARLLRRAVHESYRGVNMLESFVSLNMEAFRKIVKKHDKLTGWQTEETYMRGLMDLRIFHDDEVRDLRASMEDAYLQIEEVLCVLEPDRWRRAAARGTGAACKLQPHSLTSPLPVRGVGAGGAGSAAGRGGGGGGGGGFTPGFYEVRRRRNELLGKLRQDTRGPGNGVGRKTGPQFLAG